jgi:catechol-2,3-dioxygenase
MAAVRYIVKEIEESVAFYHEVLGFSVSKEATGFAALVRNDLTLFLNVPGAGSAGRAGGDPRPGGWCRFQVQTKDLDSMVSNLKSKGASFRGNIAEAPAGRQILLEDPSGNVVEIFEPTPKR